ncbi:hypothetical protein [Nocardia sp. SSK8]|uniref:hypothetical protein n=1 Tax=Nocardia sp. SSK8 TaxID=3120154 RepID=UPI00300BB080
MFVLHSGEQLPFEPDESGGVQVGDAVAGTRCGGAEFAPGASAGAEFFGVTVDEEQFGWVGADGRGGRDLGEQPGVGVRFGVRHESTPRIEDVCAATGRTGVRK